MPLRLIEMTKENKFSVIYKTQIVSLLSNFSMLMRIIFGAITQNIRYIVKHSSIVDGKL